MQLSRMIRNVVLPLALGAISASSASADPQADWILSSKQVVDASPSYCLFDSYEGDQSPNAIVSDQGLAAMVLMEEKLRNESLGTMGGILSSVDQDGKLPLSLNAQTGEVFVPTPNSGNIAWFVVALNYLLQDKNITIQGTGTCEILLTYSFIGEPVRNLGDGSLAILHGGFGQLSPIREIMEYLQQDTSSRGDELRETVLRDDSLKPGRISTEENAVIYSAFQNCPHVSTTNQNQFDEIKDGIYHFLKGRYSNGTDSTPALFKNLGGGESAQTQAVCTLALHSSTDLKDETRKCMETVWKNNRTTINRNGKVIEGIVPTKGSTGYISVLCTEICAAAFYELGDAERGDYLMQQMTPLITDGGLPVIAFEGSPPKGIEYTAISSTAWHYFNNHNINKV